MPKKQNPAPRKNKRRIAVIDFETDPFLYERVPAPFAGAFYDGEHYEEFWGDDAATRLIAYLQSLDEPHLIYAHNGGKFDFFFLLDALENPLKIINGRIVSAHLGAHILRDSMAILPIALDEYQKTVIDYKKFERCERERYKQEILAYLYDDCAALYELVSRFVDQFGPRLTIGGTAIKTLSGMHPFERGTARHDKLIRPWFFGGRVQCFEEGILKGQFKVYDVNSMYPHVMRDQKHPTGRCYLRDTRLPRKENIFAFVRVSGHGNRALPTRTPLGLSFELERGEFWTTTHELYRAIDYGLFTLDRVHETHTPIETISFADYVDYCTSRKIAAKESGDKVQEIFHKLLANSSYGKFGQNPESYFDYQFARDDDALMTAIAQGWILESENDYGYLVKKPSRINAWSYYDVATAASITSAARGVLMDGLQKATRAVYCDTDSIICESLDVEQHASRLGAWKLEAEGARIAIAGKKLYALFDGTRCVKIASKGVELLPNEISDIARGATIRYEKPSPTFTISGARRAETEKAPGVHFIHRNVTSRKTRELTKQNKTRKIAQSDICRTKRRKPQ